MPFFSVLIWAVILTVTLFPVYEWLSHQLGGRRGLAAPLLTLVALGVVGGTISYGLMGLLLGPIVLAVFYELVLAWMNIEPAEAPRAVP